MKIAVIGASGKAGGFVVKEAIARGHEVTAIVRNAAKITDAHVTVVEKDIFELEAKDLIQYDTVVNAFGTAPGEEHLYVAGAAFSSAIKACPAST